MNSTSSELTWRDRWLKKTFGLHFVLELLMVMECTLPYAQHISLRIAEMLYTVCLTCFKMPKCSSGVKKKQKPIALPPEC